MQKICRLLSFMICLSVLYFAVPITAYSEEPGKAVMVVIDRLTFEDMDNMPVLKDIAGKYGAGLLNTKTGGSRSSENTYATIGSSVPMLATGSAKLAFNGYEKYLRGTAVEEYLGRTGISISEQAVVQLAIARIWQQNKNLNQNIIPGALGETLAGNGFKTAVLGNGDFNGEFFRPVVNIAMNSKGFVAFGNVSTALTVNDPVFPGGKRTDYESLFVNFLQYMGAADFIVVDVGDLARLENQKNYIFEENLEKQRILTIKRIDIFLSRVVNSLNLNNDILIVVNPTPSDNVAGSGELITPVIMAGKGMESGLLVSGTTKRPGIITSTDLAPTILSFFNIQAPYYMWGRTSVVVPGDNSINALKNFKNKLVLIYNTRSPLIKGYIFAQLCLLILSLYFIFFRKDGSLLLRPFLIFLMSVPLSLLIIPLLPQSSVYAVVLEVLLTSLILTLLCMFFGRQWSLAPFLIISFITSAAIVIDLYFGALLQKQSILGYDAIAGARFYGLGNEYMGVLLGSAIISSTLLVTALPKFKRILLLVITVLYLLILYAVAAPNIGTNVGGTIAASAGFLTSILLLLNVKFNKKTLIFIPVLSFLVVISFILFDLQRDAAQQSHIGRSARLILSGGFGEVINIIVRKLEVNIKLIKYTIWSRFFLASLGSLALLFYRPVGVMKTIRSNYPDFFNGFIAIMVAALTALVFNDSGIVAAATTMIFGVPPFIFLVLYEQSKKQGL